MNRIRFILRSLDKEWFLIILIGLILRLILNNIVYSRDAYSFVMWARYLQDHSLTDLYEFLPEGYLPYPPVYYYLLMLLGKILIWFNVVNNSWQAYFIVKLPVYLSEILTATAIHYTVKSWQDKASAIISTGYYYFNPALIYVTSIWGQIDAVIICLTLFSLLAWIKHKYLIAWFIYLFAVLTKPHALVLLPLIGALSLKKLKFNYMVKLFLVLTLTSLILFSPLIIQKGMEWTARYFFQIINQYPYTSVYAYNLWSVVGFMIPDVIPTGFGLIYKYLGLGLFVSISLLIILPIIKTKHITDKNIIYASLLLWFAFYFFPTRIHSRYLIYSLGFIAPFFNHMPIAAMMLMLLIIVNLILPSHNYQLSPVVSLLQQKFSVWMWVIFGLILFIYFCYQYYLLFKKVNGTTKNTS